MYGVPYRVLAEAAGKFVVVPQGCKINGIYCSTVGKTGLPTDPEPEVPEGPTPPAVASVSPISGEGGTTVTIQGTGFGMLQGPNGKVQIGGVDLTGVSWGDEMISGWAQIGFSQPGVPVAVVVTNNAGVASNADVMFTFTEPEVIAPEITGVTPTSGPDGTELTISGTGFGALQGTGWVNVGAEAAAAYISWSDTEIVVVAAQGASPLDVAQTLQVQIDGGAQTAPFDGFTFTTAAARGTSKKAAKKTTKRDEKVAERPKIAERAGSFPSFESGGGFMLTTLQAAGGKIMMGPTELHEGQFYPLELWCMNGVEVEVSGPCDLIFVVAPQ